MNDIGVSILDTSLLEDGSVGNVRLMGSLDYHETVSRVMGDLRGVGDQVVEI